MLPKTILVTYQNPHGHRSVNGFNIIIYPSIRTVSPFHTAQQMKFSIRDFSSNCEQIRSFLRIWSHLLGKSLMENLIFCAVS